MIVSGAIFAIFIADNRNLRPLFLTSIFFSFFGLLLSATTFFWTKPQERNYTVIYESNSDSSSDYKTISNSDFSLDLDSDSDYECKESLYFTAPTTIIEEIV